MEARLNKALAERIAQLDMSRPYVWELRLSEADFNELEIWVSTVVHCHGCKNLAFPENALYTLVYIAEWYKRRYQGGNKIEWINELDLGALWRNAGLDTQYLYKNVDGRERRLYSIYVLGGLAIKHELNRCDNMRFLKALCRIYHGEEFTLEKLDEEARALAFRESIKRQHALYEFIRVILNGQFPFNEEDLRVAHSLANEFVLRIKKANEEVLRDKFRFEWEVVFSPIHNYMTRRLNLWLKPEKVGGGQHAYIRIDRLHLWGVKDPENLERFYVHVRFRNGKSIVEPDTFTKPILTFLRHNSDDFVGSLSGEWVQFKKVPSCKFDTVDILIKDDNGNEYVAQSHKTTDFIQLWEKDSSGTVWISTQHAQCQTALLFSSSCRLTDRSQLNEVYQKQFRSQQFRVGELWNWVYIHDKVSIIDNKGRTYCLYNRQGYDQVTTQLYKQTIHYLQGGKVHYSWIDKEEEPDSRISGELPVIFGIEDIIVRHFTTKEDISQAVPGSVVSAESIAFKQQNGFYAKWDSSIVPPYGVVQLRVVIKEKSYPLTALYLPRLELDCPIRRLYSEEAVQYRDLNGTVQIYHDKIPLDGVPLAPTVSIPFRGNGWSATIEVYRPTILKEVLLDGTIIDYLGDQQQLYLPYIFKERVRLTTFNEEGYQPYDCKCLGSIYRQEFIDLEHNPHAGMAALSCWKRNECFYGSLLDPLAPNWLLVGFGRPADSPIWEGQEAIYWDYDTYTEPIVCDPNKTISCGIIFQDLSKNKNLICNFPKLGDNDWIFDDHTISYLRCFEVANKRGTYFFMMYPLLTLNKEHIISELYDALKRLRAGQLTDLDKRGLRRFGEEFGFDWLSEGVNIDNE